ncbi:MAG TPA: hypothetical protein DEP28_08430 [Bacteroidetes bacterium]|nr:hypothetical protein [Bacteroidota bacterium]HCN38429.1 hypothetical protein [Bacteroidota bacterium]
MVQCLLNNTRGRIVATAYRTDRTNPWSFKFYRYDARGRVVKMWNNINGLGTKIFDYNYNSSDLVTYQTYQQGESDQQRFKYYYDNMGRLFEYSMLTGELQNPPESNLSSDYFKLFEYGYNANSQITQKDYNNREFQTMYNYNNRNWLTSQTTTDGVFDFTNAYFANGNLSNQFLGGTYKNNFPNAGSLNFSFTYDKANRLLKAHENNQLTNTYHLENTYDKDGNIKTLKRYGANENIMDDFVYTYQSGTNKLQKVSGSTTQYNYDGNGNVISDNLNNLSSFKYDYRNLITEFRKVITIPTDPPSYEVYLTEMKYDDMGMRIRKTEYLYTGYESDPVFNEDAPIGWTAISDIYYVRDFSGKEIAIYNSYDIKQWNLYGLENEGYLDADRQVRIYVKDHLGSIRVTLDDKLAVINAQDYDAWGYLLQDKTYELENSTFKFTGKERDKESGYDYFGARYYDSRIGRWGGVEPLLDKYVSFSPYCYGLNSPMVLVDVDGRDVRFSSDENTRNSQLNLLRLTLPVEYNDYINSVEDDEGNFILDIDLLNSATNLTESIEYNRLVFIAENDEITTINFGNRISYRNSETNEIQNLDLGPIGNTRFIRAGYTLVSGNIDNPENPIRRSLSGNNEVYVYNLNDVQNARTLAHELYAHVYNYLRGNLWGETNLGGEGGEIEQIETRAEENATNR